MGRKIGKADATGGVPIFAIFFFRMRIMCINSLCSYNKWIYFFKKFGYYAILNYEFLIQSSLIKATLHQFLAICLWTAPLLNYFTLILITKYLRLSHVQMSILFMSYNKQKYWYIFTFAFIPKWNIYTIQLLFIKKSLKRHKKKKKWHTIEH